MWGPIWDQQDRCREQGLSLATSKCDESPDGTWENVREVGRDSTAVEPHNSPSPRATFISLRSCSNMVHRKRIRSPK